ncbi:Folylpolyglutamate synthase [uncultured Roseburia sp.]|uniref:tetrahydrofolate synthase n=1 Tax=Brotonthovivens ammoniilytica TaxID=2981725 RepID=A0ABT2TFG9_9FIRM|nr:folylpolyglutamate synthase/dihydrofolate synthase family protein [Brotonthovivens ammoniilytica]MCU6760887.1 bifunctional folylpolyglutamate synthase/dihydrofolate synthase [Brotonthovivens ammoniilytica]SCI12312.1 Folylpolyglutamate synthase [uncultured Roseburia sp.]
MNYQESMEFLEEIKKYGSILGLMSIQNLMSELGNVQEQLPVIHVAGTNGKGSVCAMLSSVYQQAGYQVGRFCTPDVFSYEEEFLYNNTPISRERLAEIFTTVRNACRRLIGKGCPHPTRFEVETAAAWLWMWEEKIDLAIIETGLGGETDATNLITKPFVSVFSSIGMDHMQFLGNTLEKIASVKAGIIKQGCPTVSSWQQEEAADVIRCRARQKNSQCIFAEEKWIRGLKFKNGMASFSYKEHEDIKLPLAGGFQVQNAACVLETLDLLKEYFPVNEAQIVKGLKDCLWPGRLEKIGSRPDVYIDGAHNTDAAEKLKETLETCFTEKRIVYIMGVLKDKEYKAISDIMFGPHDKVFLIKPENQRGLAAFRLEKILLEMQVEAVVKEHVKDALEAALQTVDSGDMILAFGSLSYLKEVKDAYGLTGQ